MKTVDCGYNPPRKDKAPPPNEVDCGFNPPRKVAGPERGTTEGPSPSPSTGALPKHPRKV
jgi:hypothetical protein